MIDLATSLTSRAGGVSQIRTRCLLLSYPLLTKCIYPSIINLIMLEKNRDGFSMVNASNSLCLLHVSQCIH